MEELASDRITDGTVREVVQSFERAHPGDRYQYTTTPARTDYYVFDSGRYTLKELNRFRQHGLRS